MGEWKRWLPPAIAAAAILIGLFVLDWVVMDAAPFGTLHISPLGSELCIGPACADAPSRGSTWGILGKLALGGGVLAAVGLGIVAAFRFLGTDPAYFGKATAGLCALTATVSVLALIAVAPDSVGDYSAGGLVTIAAAAFGISVRSGGSGGAFDGGASAVPIRSTATVKPAADAAPAKVARPNPVGPVASDAARGALRFVVVDGTITPTGLTLRMERNVERVVAWSDIVEVVARRMPPDPPFEKLTFVDLVTASGPVRLLPSSRLDYASLPGGMAPNTRENLRRLVALAREQHPAIAIEAESADFFAGGRDALMFAAFKKFQEWERRYD
jgi:hypothetical protein